MRSLLIYLTIFLSSLLLQFIPITASGSTTLIDDTWEFQRVAMNMKKFLEKVDRLEPEVTKQENGNVVIVTKKITEYVLAHKNKFDILKNKLEEFITKFPDSEWHEDAVVLLGASYLTVNLKEAPFTKGAIDTYSKIIEIDKKFNINSWTKHLLSDLKVASIFEPIPGEDWMTDLKENEILKVIFSRALVTEYLKIENFERAEHLVDIFKNRSDIVGASQNIKSLEKFTSIWKNKIKKAR